MDSAKWIPCTTPDSGMRGSRLRVQGKTTFSENKTTFGENKTNFGENGGAPEDDGQNDGRDRHLCEHHHNLSNDIGAVFSSSVRRPSWPVRHPLSRQQACPALLFVTASVSSTPFLVSKRVQHLTQCVQHLRALFGCVPPLPIVSASEICAKKTFELSSDLTPPLPLMNERSRKCNSCSIFASKVDVSRENIVQF